MLPRTPLQAVLRRYVAGGWAFNPWFTGALGAVVAVIVGLSLTVIVGLLWGHLVQSPLVASSPASVVFEVLGGATTAFQRPTLLNLFAIEHHVPLSIHLASAARGGGVSGDGTLALPLLGLLVVPVLALTLGGYIAAASDYSRVARFSIARGALVAPFYAILLFVLALVGASGGGAVMLHPSPFLALFYGLLWGAIFGALGGWIHLSGRHWLAGALVAMVCGVLMCVALGCAALALVNVQAAAVSAGATVSTASPHIGGLSGLGTALAAILVIGPTVGVWAFAGATGAALDTRLVSSVGSATSQHATLGFVGAQHAPTPQIWLLMALVPLICYLVGGRVAARIAGASTVRDGAQAGALMAVPLSLLMGLLAGASTLTLSMRGAGSGGSLMAGPSVGGTFLATLLVGAVVGGLGGASAVALPALGDMPRLPLAPVRPLGWRVFALLDQLTSREPGEPLTAARAWFYDGVLAAALLGGLALAAELVTTVAARTVALDRITTIDTWLAAALVGIPLLFFIGALVTAFTAPPPVPSVGVPPGEPITLPAARTNPAMTPGGLPTMVTPMVTPMEALPPAEPRDLASGGASAE
jgi:hypothetical protein